MSLTWTLDIDWDNDAVLETDEASRLMDLKIERGRDNYLARGGEGFEPYEVGKAVLTLDNSGQRYDALNTASPLYGNISIGRYAQITVDDGGGAVPVFTGRIAEIKPYGTRTDPLARMILEDGWRVLRTTPVSKKVQADILTSAAISTILTEASWPALWGSTIDTAIDTIPYWWVDNRKAAAEIHDLVSSELGQFFLDASGQAVFRGRHYVESSVGTITEAICLKDIDTPMPWEILRNDIHVRCYPRKAQAVSVVWTYPETPFVASGETLTLWAEYRYNDIPCPIYPLTTPVTPTDWTMNENADGSGADRSSQFTVTATDLGLSAKVEIECTGADGGYVTLCQLRGVALTALDTIIQKAEVSTSITSLRSRLNFTLDALWQQNSAVAWDFAHFLRVFLLEYDALPVFKMEDRSDQWDYDIGDLVTVNFPTLGINSLLYHIGKIEHRWMRVRGGVTSQAVETTFKTEPFMDTSSYWKYTATMGTTTIFAY